MVLSPHVCCDAFRHRETTKVIRGKSLYPHPGTDQGFGFVLTLRHTQQGISKISRELFRKSKLSSNSILTSTREICTKAKRPSRKSQNWEFDFETWKAVWLWCRNWKARATIHLIENKPEASAVLIPVKMSTIFIENRRGWQIVVSPDIRVVGCQFCQLCQWLNSGFAWVFFSNFGQGLSRV